MVNMVIPLVVIEIPVELMLMLGTDVTMLPTIKLISTYLVGTNVL